jgi:tRNA-splicing ligase RtcB
MEFRNKLKRISSVVWEIPGSFRNDMRVPARIYASEQMLDLISQDRSMEQLVNVCSLPGIVNAAMVMPDVHEGYGFPIGGVAATEYPDGVISPGGIGYDINCGVRLLRTSLNADDVSGSIEKLSVEIFRSVPCGVGKGGFLKLSSKELDNVLLKGAEWAVHNGYGKENDLPYLESGGCIPGAEPSAVSGQAKKRGSDQLGTMGAGNHFVEVDRVAEIFDKGSADAFGLFHGQLVMLIHTGSRGLGHQVATDYIRLMLNVMGKYNIHLPDRELACVPLSSPEGKDYFSAMASAANFAFANRQLITWEVREAFGRVFAGEDEPGIIYDVAHNIAKLEHHLVNGKLKELIVHRKGATRAFGPGNDEVPAIYRDFGQPVLIPGSMGTASYVLAGTSQSEESFGSACHGAGRQMSRHAARKKINADELRKKLLMEGIIIQAGSRRGVAEEAPAAYKDVDSVVDVVDKAGIAKKVARLKPLAVIKG